MLKKWDFDGDTNITFMVNFSIIFDEMVITDGNESKNHFVAKKYYFYVTSTNSMIFGKV